MAQEPGVGFEYPSRKVSWLKRDVLLFNLSIGATANEQHLVYEKNQHFPAFSTYPLALNFKVDQQEVIDFYSTQSAVDIPGVPELNPQRLVDGQRSIEPLKRLPVSSAGRDFEFRSKVLGVFDKGSAGTVVKLEDSLVDASNGEVYTRIVGSLFYIGQGGWGGPRGAREHAVLPPVKWDYNPLHGTPASGKKMGYGGIILHGVYAYNVIAHELVREWVGSDPESLKFIEAKFCGVVRPGDQILVSVWHVERSKKPAGEEFVWFAKVVGLDRLCISDGRAILEVSKDVNKMKL